MLDDKVILPMCYYWAKRFMQRNVEFDELVIIGYIAAKPLRDVKLAQKWIKYVMLDFVVSLHKSKDKIKHTLSSIENDIEDNSHPSWEKSEIVEDVRYVLNKAGLNDRDRLLIQLRFYDCLKWKDVGEKMGIRASSAYVRMKSVLSKMKKFMGIDM